MHLYFSMFGNRIKFLKKHTFTYALKFKIIFQITKKKKKQTNSQTNSHENIRKRKKTQFENMWRKKM